MEQLMVFEERELLGKDFRMYGDKENPLFLAKDVAEWIEERDGYTVARKVDAEEKLIHTLCVAGQNREMTFLTEDGFYEVLMQSRKPIAKAFKKEVKKILKEIRTTGGYIPGQSEEEILANAVLIANRKIEQLKEKQIQSNKYADRYGISSDYPYKMIPISKTYADFKMVCPSITYDFLWDILLDWGEIEVVTSGTKTVIKPADPKSGRIEYKGKHSSLICVELHKRLLDRGLRPIEIPEDK